jgi:hypothetical protein
MSRELDDGDVASEGAGGGRASGVLLSVRDFAVMAPKKLSSGANESGTCDAGRPEACPGSRGTHSHSHAHPGSGVTRSA